MAAAEVLALPELLENVLRHLDVETLLLSQRVNTLFKSGIQRSKDLQEKLYFRHQSSTKSDADVTLNPLLTEPHEVWTKIRRTLQWHFAFDSFRLPPIQAQEECTNADLVGENCMIYTADGPKPLQGEMAFDLWKGEMGFDKGVSQYSTAYTCDPWTKYESEVLDDFLRKTISAGKLRFERNSNMASYEGFDWEESTWVPPVGAASYDVYGDYVTQQKVMGPVR